MRERIARAIAGKIFPGRPWSDIGELALAAADGVLSAMAEPTPRMIADALPTYGQSAPTSSDDKLARQAIFLLDGDLSTATPDAMSVTLNLITDYRTMVQSAFGAAA